MPTYGQFCPVAMASEVITERWTPLVLRELIAGSHRFNELRRGVPLMSPSLLSKRLKTLERAGVVERRSTNGGASVEYYLTPAGEELRPLIEMLGTWGTRWVRGRDVMPEHLDASMLMWDIRRGLADDRLPPGRVVVHFHLHGSTDGKRRFWLVLDGGDADLCLVDPGHEVDVHVECDVATMVAIWMGDTTFGDAERAGALTVDGPARLVRSFPSWFRRSLFADVPRAERA